VAQEATSEHGRRFQLQAFPPKRENLAASEDLLFSKVPRAKLNAADLVGTFQEGPFSCRLLDIGTGKHASRRRWKATAFQLLVQSWSQQPPQSLVGAFKSAHAILPDRLTDELVGQMAIAADTAAERKAFDRLQQNLTKLRAMLSEMP